MRQRGLACVAGADALAIPFFHLFACFAQAIQLINHDGEVNRARYMPQNPFMLATKTVRHAPGRSAAQR